MWTAGTTNALKHPRKFHQKCHFPGKCDSAFATFFFSSFVPILPTPFALQFAHLWKIDMDQTLMLRVVRALYKI